MSNLIPLTQGQVTLVDEADYEWLSQWKWFAYYCKSTGTFYARRSLTGGGCIQMHRAILGLTDSKIQGDHKDGNTLDNRRENLRVATHGQNAVNRRKQKNNTSGYKGVFWSARHKKWRVLIRKDGKLRSCGYYDTPEEAAAVYKQKSQELHGEFARSA